MKRIPIYWLVMVLIALLTTSCRGSGGAQPGSPAGGEAGAGQSGGDPQETAFHITMSAQVDGLVADMAYDQLESEWVGDFTVNAEGLINGEGVVVYDALIFAVDEELCGYNWAEKGEANYVISGKVLEEGGETFYPLKILLRDVERLDLQGPDATCADPSYYYKEMPDQYLTIHRDGLLGTVLSHLHQSVGNQIQWGQKLEQTSGTVSYQIEVSLAPIPLD